MIKKIVLALILSLSLTFFLVNAFFFKGVPKINAVKITRMAKNLRDEVIIFRNTIGYKLSSKKIDYNQVLGDGASAMTFEFDEVTPTVTPRFTPTPFVFPTVQPSPQPTVTPVPTTAFDPTRIPVEPTEVIAPTKKPTKAPTPVPTDEPVEDSLLVEDPLDQPYYNPRLAYKCYNSDKFIEVYGGGGTGGACYGNAKAYVEKNLTSVSILGKSITVHKKAYPAFKAVSDKLKNFKGYKINTIGAYVFRCNVNASSVDRFDLCADGCVLSAHAFGIAVDINWEENCNGCSNFDLPREIIDAFESYGFRWGGRYKSIFGSTIDPMHFEYMYDLCKGVN